MEEKYILWKPLVDYSLLSKDEINQKTGMRLNALVETYDELTDAKNYYTEKINGLLRKGGAVRELYEIVMEENFKNCCYIDYVFSSFLILAQIAYMEQVYMKSSILDKASDMEGVCDYGQQIIFGLRRLEFDWEETAVEEFLEWLLSERISYVVLEELIAQPLFVDKLLICKRLYRFYTKRGNKMEGVKLFFIMAKRQQQEYYYVELALVLLDAGELRLGYELIKEIENPSDDIQNFLQMLKKRLPKHEQ